VPALVPALLARLTLLARPAPLPHRPRLVGALVPAPERLLVRQGLQPEIWPPLPRLPQHYRPGRKDRRSRQGAHRAQAYRHSVPGQRRWARWPATPEQKSRAVPCLFARCALRLAGRSQRVILRQRVIFLIDLGGRLDHFALDRGEQRIPDVENQDGARCV